MERAGTLSVRPIEPADVERVAAFLARTMPAGPPARTWARAARAPWGTDQPNHGFLLEHGGDVVGANLAFYSERVLSTGAQRFCNLAALSVLPEHRASAVRLARALLAQPGHAFTDLSPSGQVVDIDRRLGFRPLDTTTAFGVNRPGGRAPRGVRVVTGADAIDGLLEDPRERQVLADHRDALAARHLLVVRGERQCYVLYRRDTRKRLRCFATLLHVSDPELYTDSRSAVDRVLLREGALVTLVELRVLGGRVPPGARLYAGRPKLVKGKDLPLDEVDDLYSELTCVPW
ncbi:hypothetical protein [Microlunatus sagamiharensis]|uniref:hypothetical protein n=1 Tax=Microlunatus sagamiharensis TaxID=546874 RepID=UPI0012FDDAD0|nr:hypothetical protein [Microlunatus sagamiharensis]